MTHTNIEVNYIHHCGDDLSVVNAARVSFGKRVDEMKSADVALIQFLAEHEHYSPFKHQFVTMHVRAPIFVARQLVKHEYMPWNEISGRYVEFGQELYWPEVWRKGAKNIKQGSLAEEVDLAADFDIIQIQNGTSVKVPFLDSVQVETDSQIKLYHELLRRGVCREQARMVLPLNLMTEWYWSGVLFSWMKMINLRIHPTAQRETQLVANLAYDILEPLFPFSTSALLRNQEDHT